MCCWSGFEAICRTDEPLARHTWYKLGGPARWFFTPQDEQQLASIIQRCRDSGVRWRILGGGANVLVRDEGVKDAVIRLTGPHFERLVAPNGDHVIEAGAGVDFTRLIKMASERGWTGLESLAGIPGSVGGAIRMNAGGKYGSIAEFVTAATILDSAGQIDAWPLERLGFRYRHSELDGCVVLSARIRFTPGEPAATRERFRAIWNEKYSTQPPVSDRSAGCIFKNPAGQSAGALIDKAGLKGHRIGTAEISTQHANFIVADRENARSDDVLRLIDLARDRVSKAFGVELKLEVDVW